MPGHTKLAEGTLVGGDYKVLESLGVGGMGTVYAAEQLSTGRRRALKVMHGQVLDDDKQRERFVREAVVGSSIDSAHVVDVIGAGIEEDGTAWIAMELLEGEDLQSLLARHGPLAPAELLELLEQMCHALGAAHEARVVHRDIKPENIYVTTPRQARGRPLVKILDFGIAKIASRVRTGSTTAIGSPAWMAPEQANPEVPISPATDVWALGVLTFWLLTGRSYWKSWSQGQGSIHALMKEILFDPLPPASKRAVELGVSDRLPDGFDGWFERCVHREPRARFHDARALLEAFEALVGEGEPERTQDETAARAPLATAEIEPAEPMSTRAFLSSSEIDEDDLPLSQPEPPVAATPPSPRGAEAAAGDPLVVPEDTDAAPSQTAEPTVVDSRAPGRWPRRTLAMLGVVAAAVVTVMVVWTSRDGGTEGSDDISRREPTASPRNDQESPELPPAPRQTAMPTATVASAMPTATPEEVPTRATASAVAASSPAPAGPPSLAASVPTATVGTSEASTPPSTDAAAAAASSVGDAAAPKRPFDRHTAQYRVAARTKQLRMRCGHRSGPKALSGMVVFEPSGLVLRVEMSDHRQRSSPGGMCVSVGLRSLSVQPYDGGLESVAFALTLD